MPYVCGRTIGALWAINEPDNAWVWVNDLGWRKLATSNTRNLLLVRRTGQNGRQRSRPGRGNPGRPYHHYTDHARAVRAVRDGSQPEPPTSGRTFTMLWRGKSAVP